MPTKNSRRLQYRGLASHSDRRYKKEKTKDESIPKQPRPCLTDIPQFVVPYITELSQQNNLITNVKRRLLLCLPLWLRNENIVEFANEYVENYYSIGNTESLHRKGLALLLDPKNGFNDVWSSLISINLCCIVVPDCCVNTVSVLLSAIIHDFLNNYSLSDYGSKELEVGLGKINRLGLPHKNPVYAADWVLTNTQSKSLWFKIADTVHKSMGLVRKVLILSGMKDFQILDHTTSSRSIILRKYSGPVSETVETVIDAYNASNAIFPGFVANNIELCCGGCGDYEPHPIRNLYARKIMKDQDGKPFILDLGAFQR